MSFNYAEILQRVVPETIVVVTALVVLTFNLLVKRTADRMSAALSSLGCMLAIVWIWLAPNQGNILDGMLVVDPLTQFMKQVLLGLTIFTAVISMPTRFTRHVGEYFALLLFASAGMMFLVSSENLLMIFVALELVSLSLYVMVAFHKESLQSAEAALKYFLFGGMSAAFMLFGLSLVYGLTGEINLGAIAAKLAGQTTDPLILVALVMTLIGFGFKIAAVPFHLWAPDAYQGAPTPTAALIAAGSKVASFFILAKIVMVGFKGAGGNGAFRNFHSGWIPVLAAMAALSMVLGNLAAISQSSVKRLLAYSAIAHGGYALLAIIANDPAAVGSLLYYIITYAATVLGAFAVVDVVEQNGQGDKLSSFAGLSQRAPLVSACMMVFMLSLAGIPPLAGFFGKFYVFVDALRFGAPRLGLLWLVVLAIGTSAISLYYYLQVLKQIYVANPIGGLPALRIATPVRAAIVILAAIVVLLGCFPDLLVSHLFALMDQIRF
ncbi:MAG: NADH-quinone oxidoreductase subunit N [Verrucomicrobiota bacterium]